MADADDAVRQRKLLEQGFSRRLNEHGYGFQYGLLQRVEQLAAAGRSVWDVETSEFPVTLGDDTTHIDFVLRDRQEPGLRVVAECKRVNPALPHWCFLRLPHVPHASDVGIEKVMVVFGPNEYGLAPYGTAGINPDRTWPSERVYNLGLVIREQGGVKGEAGGDNRNAIRDATAQVQRATSGLMEFLVQEGERLLPKVSTKRAVGRVLPVIFTDAQLWVSDVNLAACDVTTGEVPPGSLTPTDWLWLKQNISPGIRPDLAAEAKGGNSLRSYVIRDFSRSIAIVRPEGAEPFLQTLHEMATT